MKWMMVGLLCLAATGCGGNDSVPIISERDASGAECTAGGTVLLVDGKTAALVCNGANGRDGAPGAQGTPGERGNDGADGEPGLAGPAGAPGESAPSPPNIVAGVAAKAAAIVIVECTDGDKTGDGSGTKTDRGTVITAMHVVDDMTSCNVFSQAPVAFLGTMTRATQRGSRDQVELSMDWTTDGSRIAGVTPTLRVVPAIGDLVTVVGHPGVYDGLSLEHQYTTGFVTATDLTATLASVPTLVNAGLTTRWAQSWSTDAVAWHGNSGGPVFDAAGNWIGILVGAFNGSSDNEGPDLSIVLPLR